MTRNKLVNLIFVTALLFSMLPAFSVQGAGGPGDTIKQAAANTQVTIKDSLIQEAVTWGVPIAPDSVMYASEEGTVAVNSVIQNGGQGAVTAGVDMGFMYLSDNSSSQVPEGFYIVNVKGAIESGVGTATLLNSNRVAVASNLEVTFTPVTYPLPWPYWFRGRSLHIYWYPNGHGVILLDYFWYYMGRWYEVIVRVIRF